MLNTPHCGSGDECLDFLAVFNIVLLFAFEFLMFLLFLNLFIDLWFLDMIS